MNLSNRLTFSLIFSVVLVALFALVVAPAMAEVTVTAYKTTDAPDATTAGKVVITLTYSDDPNPRPNFSHFTAADDQIQPDDSEIDRDVLIASYNDGTDDITAAIGGSGRTVTLTITAPVNVAVVIPTALQLRGYSDDLGSVQESTAEQIADGTNTPTTLALADDHIAGYGYLVYARAAGNSRVPDSFTDPAIPPHLPTGITAQVITAEGNNANSNVAMPDLEEFFFVGGGTINLNIEGTGADSRQLVINEVMWAVDDRLIGQDGYLAQQWIEVWNPKTTPVPEPKFEFLNNPSGLNPPAAIAAGTADRLTNIPSRTSVWNVKGQNGSSTLTGTGTNITGANPTFISMYRNDIRGGDEGSGSSASNWTASGRAFLAGFYGTPGRANTRGGLPTARPPTSAYTPPKNSVIINEVFNHGMDNDLDWIEFRNVGSGEANLKNWRLNHTGNAANDNNDNADEENIIHFHVDIKIPAGEVLLIVNKDPEETNLAAGQDIREARPNQTLGAGQHKYLNIKRSHGRALHIPAALNGNNGGFLILRNNADNKFRASRANMHDVAGPSRVTKKTRDAAGDIKEPEAGNNYWDTDAWPINGHTGNYRAHNAKDSNNNNASLDPAANFAHGRVWARNGTAHGWRKGGGNLVDYSGGLGYDRGFKGSGTPGYHNDAVKGKTGDITDGKLIISELMLNSDGGRYPQWIELHNTSRTRGINLSSDGSDPKTGWQMIIENHNSGSWADNDRPLVATINLREFGDIKYIPPNQTVLIVSRTGRNSGTPTNGHFPSHRVASVWGNSHARGQLKPKTSRDDILNAAGGFYIKIVDGDGIVSDEIGNLDGKAADLRQGIPLDDPYSWKWPTGLTEDGIRTSLIRLMDGTFGDDNVRGIQGERFGTAGTPRTAVPNREVDGDMTGAVIPLGTASNRRGAGKTVGEGDDAKTHAMNPDFAKAAWVHAVDTAFANAKNTWYGNSDDIGTPLHTTGTPLPVSLSFFRPTLEDGKVVIRWTTESELDNAGFNILRSDSRNGEFKQVNDKLIQGKGTTAERSTYKWVDTSAKPGAVYYYQIEDVSFAGERTTLTTTKLKGLISAKNKLTTTWSELKSQN